MTDFGELRSLLASPRRDQAAFEELGGLVSRAWEARPDEVEQAWIPYALRELECWDDEARALRCQAHEPRVGVVLARRVHLYCGDLPWEERFWLDGWELAARELHVLSGTFAGPHLEQLRGMRAPHVERLVLRLDATPDELGGVARALDLPSLRALEVRSRDGVAAFIDAMAGSLETDRLEEVVFVGDAMGEGGIEALAAMPLGSLRRLDLGGLCSGCRGVDALCSRRWPGLESLTLSEGAIDDDALAELLRADAFPDATSLDLSGNDFGARGVSALMHGAAFARLRHLDLSSNDATLEPHDEDVVAPAPVVEVAALESLSLGYSDYDQAALEFVLSSARCRALRRLDARFTDPGDALVAALTSSGLHAHLEELDLGNVTPSVEGHAAWLEGVVWLCLRRLSLYAHRLGPEALELLTAQAFPALESLSLSGARFAFGPLTRAPWFARLRELDLAMTPTTDMDLTLLASLDDLALEVLDVGKARVWEDYDWVRRQDAYSDPGVEALSGALGLGNLRELHLDAQGLTAQAWRALATSDALPRLTRVRARLERGDLDALSRLAAGPRPVAAWVHDLIG